MFSLQQLVRKNIAALESYTSARSEFKGTEGIFLDANENPYGPYNRYPDPLQQLLKQELARQKGVPAANIFIGNGSDEIIDLCLRIFCDPGRDKALTFSPTYGMYAVAAAINDVELVSLPLDNDFRIVYPTLSPLLADERLKMLFICSPNNPTGNGLEGIEKILQQFKGIVVVDEAYIDFSDSPSLISRDQRLPQPHRGANPEQGMGTGRCQDRHCLCTAGDHCFAQQDKAAIQCKYFKPGSSPGSAFRQGSFRSQQKYDP